MRTFQKSSLSIFAILFLLFFQNSNGQWSGPATTGYHPGLLLTYSYEKVTAGRGYQDLKIICRNLTSDKIQFRISYEIHFHNGEVEVIPEGSPIVLKPGETLDPRSVADWGGVYKRYFLNPSGGKYGAKERWYKSGKDKYGKYLYSAIYAVMKMEITDFVNISQKDSDAKIKKEEAEKKRKEEAEKNKKEQEARRMKEIEEKKLIKEGNNDAAGDSDPGKSTDFDKLKKKLSAENNPKAGSKAKSGSDDFWSGNEEKNTSKKGKNDDGDFWSGAESKKTGSEITGKADISSGIEGMHNIKLGVLQLIHSNGSIIKEWSDKEYHSLEKIDKKGEYFKLYAKKSGSEFLERNNYTIVEKFGKIQTINGLQDFAYIKELPEGGFYLELYTSNILHREKLFNGGTLSFQKSYDSSSEAVSELQKIITRRKEEIKRNSTAKPGDIIIGYDNKYEVIQKKRITLNSKMQPLISKVFYIIHQY